MFFQLIHDVNEYDSRQLPPHFKHIDLTYSPKLGVYRPILDEKQFWSRSHSVYEPEVEYYNTTVTFNIYWSFKYFLEVQMEESQKIQSEWGL